MAPAGKGDRVMQRMFACLLVFVVLGLSVGLIVYDRDTLLLIRDTVSDDLRPSFVFEPPMRWGDWLTGVMLISWSSMFLKPKNL
jgi:hypothetical protein